MREIGGFFELELNKGGDLYHDDALALNNGSNALKFFLKQSNYKTVYLPYYTCDSVLSAIKSSGLEFRFYSIDLEFNPLVNLNVFNKKTLLIYNNYFGLNLKKVKQVLRETQFVLIDSSQAFYYKPEKNTPTFNSVRKFFGVPDGGFLYGSSVNKNDFYKELPHTTYTKNHLIDRLEFGASKSYDSYLKSEKELKELHLGKMSKLTKSLLRNVDFSKVRQTRVENYNLFQEKFSESNDLKLDHLNSNSDSVPLCYPLLINKGASLKNYLISHDIYVPTYWANVLKWKSDKASVENKLVENLVCLPIDQRYNKSDMNHIVEIIESFHNE
ncbi:hypothetical protein LB450_12350 [Psychroflexus sp. CAK1W]|uniref:hypothetical protein n=1 Tax=Psychroflexus curvus TaxID=2873595 RepID=UPI001CCBFFB0|nr:hypothetical protein [Psychroflexus curvus]MBZ9628897.1 hypothetical protein [Psychroflexus curvus]